MNSNPAGHSRPIVTQEWSLHAELTFTQPTPGSANQRPSSAHQGLTTCEAVRQLDPNNRMNMQYLWNTQPEQSSSRRTPHPCYGFQRGNILFTTSPPSRNLQNNQTHNQPVSQPKGPPQPTTGDQIPLGHNRNQASVTNRNSQPYNRRCKSTCSIILSGDHASSSHRTSDTVSCNRNVDRGRSCSPVTRCFHTLTHRCGDPICYHASTSTTPVDTLCSASGFSSTIPESCEVCGGGRSPTAVRRAAKANTFTTHFCTRVPERVPASSSGEKKTVVPVKESKDASSQTSDIIPVKCNVPQHVEKSEVDERNKVISAPRLESSLGKKKPGKKKSYSTKSRDQPSLHQEGEPAVNTEISSPGVESSCHKPRTVHIDVYCTGSEDADADTSDLLDTETDSAEEGESWSSPQTVFESDKLRVVHRRASKNQLPQALQLEQVANKKSDLSQRSGSFRFKSPIAGEVHSSKGFDSDDGLTSQYPSKESSYTTLQDAESSLQSDIPGASRDASWSTISSSLLYGDGYDSATATSWKDTATELDSLVQSDLSLAQSDSFDYADAIDRLRIREKERAWAGVERNDASDQIKSWQCPQTERKRLLQQQKLQEYVAKHLGEKGFPLWKPETCEDSDEDEDETGDTWSFGGGPSSPKLGTLRKEESKKSNKPEQIVSSGQSTPVLGGGSRVDKGSLRSNTPHLLGDSGSLSDSGHAHYHRFIPRLVIGPFGSKSPSPPPAKLESTITSPFTTMFGRRTDQLLKAQKFGTIVGTFKKPGHHVGPSKNPDCSCVHCREYYQGSAHRGRARSVGDVPIGRQAGKINS